MRRVFRPPIWRKTNGSGARKRVAQYRLASDSLAAIIRTASMATLIASCVFDLRCGEFPTHQLERLGPALDRPLQLLLLHSAENLPDLGPLRIAGGQPIGPRVDRKIT